MKLTAKTKLTMVTLLLASFASQASGYKMVVIGEDALAPLISNGTAPEQILTAASSQTADPLSRQINLCVAFTQQAATAEASTACHQAVIQARYASDRSGMANSRILRSYTLTNRGVQKVRCHDKVGALADFQAAVALTNDAITRHNLDLLVSQLNEGATLVASVN